MAVKITRRNALMILNGIVLIGVSSLIVNNFISRIPSKPKKRAILVNQDEMRLDPEYLKEPLSKRGYECFTIQSSRASQKNILEKLAELSGESRAIDETIYFHSGHGGVFDFLIGKTYTEALALNGYENFDELTLTPQELMGAMGKFKGKKAIMIDSCNGGAFVDYLKNISTNENNQIIRDYSCLASCPSGYSTLSVPLDYGYKLGPLCYSLIELFNEKPKNPINLSKAEILCGPEYYRKNLDEVISSFDLGNSEPISFELQRISDTDFYL
jgi:hypothetical protein